MILIELTDAYTDIPFIVNVANIESLYGTPDGCYVGFYGGGLAAKETYEEIKEKIIKALQNPVPICFKNNA